MWYDEISYDHPSYDSFLSSMDVVDPVGLVRLANPMYLMNSLNLMILMRPMSLMNPMNPMNLVRLVDSIVEAASSCVLFSFSLGRVRLSGPNVTTGSAGDCIPDVGLLVDSPHLPLTSLLFPFGLRDPCKAVFALQVGLSFPLWMSFGDPVTGMTLAEVHLARW